MQYISYCLSTFRFRGTCRLFIGYRRLGFKHIADMIRPACCVVRHFVGVFRPGIKQLISLLEQPDVGLQLAYEEQNWILYFPRLKYLPSFTFGLLLDIAQ